MPTTLSYGYKKPVDGDTGQTIFDALEENVQRLNDHTHDGSNSARLTSTSLTSVTQAVSSASWSHQGAGTYRQLVTLPTGFAYDTCIPSFRDSATGHVLTLSIEKVSSTTFYVYINDNTKNLTAVYSS